MDRKVLWICMIAGSTAGGFVPALFGQSSMGLLALLGATAGGIAGVWAAARISA